MAELLGRVAHQQALLDAWHRVRERARERGRLGAEHAAFEHVAARRLADISAALLGGAWRPSPVRPASIPKPSGGTRTLGVPALEDAVVERALLGVLDPLVDRELLPWSFAYRRGFGVHDAIRCLLDERDHGCGWVVRGDFTDCFDQIPRRPVLDRLAGIVDDEAVVELVRLLVYRPVAGSGESAPRGLHQGSPLSPLLANLHLDGFDRAMLQRGWLVVRYGDDFAVPVADRGDAAEVLRRAHESARAVGLELSDHKCSVRGFEEGVPFLGQVLTAGTATRTERQSHPRATTVYVNEPGGLLRSRGDRLRLERGGELTFGIAYARVRQVVVIGRVGMTTPFLHQVLARGIDLVLLSDHGRYIGRLRPSTGANTAVRQRQYEAARVRAESLDLARRVVAAKITNLRGGLLRAARRRRDAELDRLVERLERRRGEAEACPSVAALMGTEGSATRDYFAGLRLLLDDGWGFEARRRRPPPDPVNALLSFGYTLLLQEAIAAAEIADLDPYLGFLHQPRVGRPSLALDLVEELRPVIVDSVVLRVLNTRMVRAEHFTTDEGPPRSCLLNGDGRRQFLAAYERRMLTLFTHTGSGRRVSYRVGLGLQARSLADELLGKGGRYEPVVWK